MIKGSQDRKRAWLQARAIKVMEHRQLLNKQAYDKARKRQADYKAFQTRRIINTVKGIVPEGGRHG